MSRLTLIFFIFILVACQTSTQPEKDTNAVEMIKKKLTQWVQDFENKNIEGVKSIFSRDLIGSYQGSPDQRFQNIEESYWFGNDTISPKYHLEIEEIQANDGLGYVRDTWTYTEQNLITNKIDTLLKIRSYEIWTKENDGEWRIIRWISYPMENIK